MDLSVLIDLTRLGIEIKLILDFLAQHGGGQLLICK